MWQVTMPLATHSPSPSDEAADLQLAAATAHAALASTRDAEVFLEALMPKYTDARTRRPYQFDREAEAKERNREVWRVVRV